MLWSMVSKAAERSRRQRQDNLCVKWMNYLHLFTEPYPQSTQGSMRPERKAKSKTKTIIAIKTVILRKICI